jgi:hypothetical protein
MQLCEECHSKAGHLYAQINLLCESDYFLMNTRLASNEPRWSSKK